MVVVVDVAMVVVVEVTVVGGAVIGTLLEGFRLWFELICFSHVLSETRVTKVSCFLL